MPDPLAPASVPQDSTPDATRCFMPLVGHRPDLRAGACRTPLHFPIRIDGIVERTGKNRPETRVNTEHLAEAVGFEPTVPLQVRLISSLGKSPNDALSWASITPKYMIGNNIAIYRNVSWRTGMQHNYSRITAQLACAEKGANALFGYRRRVGAHYSAAGPRPGLSAELPSLSVCSAPHTGRFPFANAEGQFFRSGNTFPRPSDFRHTGTQTLRSPAADVRFYIHDRSK